MNMLKEFELKISLVDGMLIETRGWFGKNSLDNYLNSCVEIAVKYYQKWKYYDYEMHFLDNLKMKIEQL